MKKLLLLNLLALFFIQANSQNWLETQKISASDRKTDAFFGRSASISGNYAVVGSHLDNEYDPGGNLLVNIGAAYIYEKDANGIWSQVQKITAPDTAAQLYFGISVDVSDNYIIARAFLNNTDASGGSFISQTGYAYIFERDSIGNWKFVQKLVASDRSAMDHFGSSFQLMGTMLSLVLQTITKIPAV